jgi:hypothetical protein
MKPLSELAGRLLAPRRIASWIAALPDRTAALDTLLPGLLERWQRYHAAGIDRAISPETT